MATFNAKRSDEMKLENLLNKPYETADGRPGPTGRQGIEKMKVTECDMSPVEPDWLPCFLRLVRTCSHFVAKLG